MIKIHQSQLKGLSRAHSEKITNDPEWSFTDWCNTYVGEYTQDWGRIYDLNRSRPTYGTTWWFRDPTKATLTLLRWS